MIWQVLEYSPAQVKRAGKTIRDQNCSAEDYRSAVLIVDNWRAAHAYPLRVVYTHLKRLTRTNPEVIVAQRLKRLDSILGKLQRFCSMSLWTIQDLGGCRVIAPTMRQVYKIASDYQHSNIRHIFKAEYDYLATPKLSGYRSLHHVYEFRSDKVDCYNNNILIEIQYRTRLQHAWATAVETLGLFTDEALKADQGDEETKRFFALASSLFALEERSPIVPNTPEDVTELVTELKELNIKRNYLEILRAINDAAKHIAPMIKGDIGYAILKIELAKKALELLLFTASEHEKALEVYQEIELNRENQNIDAVLVRTASFHDLKLAYPNYFMDNRIFIARVERYLNTV